MPCQDAGRAPDSTVPAMVGVSRGRSFPQGAPVPGALLDRHRRSTITAGEKLRQRPAFMLDPLLADQSASSRATEASV